jgi:hypothetical protein
VRAILSLLSKPHAFSSMFVWENEFDTANRLEVLFDRNEHRAPARIDLFSSIGFHAYNCFPVDAHLGCKDRLVDPDKGTCSTYHPRRRYLLGARFRIH